MQHGQLDSKPGADKVKDSREKSFRKTLTTSHVRRYDLELWVKVEVNPWVYSPPEDDTYGVDFVIDSLNQAYPGCTEGYLSKAGHILAFYRKKGMP